MTGGWQGDQNGGYGGGWQPQQDPYQQPQYGPPYDPYGQYQQQDPYAAQGYPGYDPGFGQEPPKKSKLPIVLSIIAIVAIIGGVVAIVLLNRDDDPSPAANSGPASTTTNKPATSKVPPSPTSRKPPSSGAQPPPKDGWSTVKLADGTGSYQVPEDWKPSLEKKDSGLSVQFGDVTESGDVDYAAHREQARRLDTALAERDVVAVRETFASLSRLGRESARRAFAALQSSDAPGTEISRHSKTQ